MSTARRTGRTCPSGALAMIGAVVASAVLVTVLAGCSGQAAPSRATSSASSSESALGYRSLPTFLPTQTAPVDRVVTATATHPQLAVQGVGVQVSLPDATVLATVTGPHVPPFVTPPPPQVTAIFDVSFTRATGSVPVRLADFTITDQLGRTFHPAFVAHTSAPPGTLATGRAMTFELTAAMPTGEGRIYWSPTGGSPVVGWDFIVEND